MKKGIQDLKTKK